MATKKKKVLKYKKHNHVYLPMIHLGKNKLTPELYKKVQEVKKRHERIMKQQKRKIEKTKKLIKKTKKIKKPSPKPTTPGAPKIPRRPRKRTSSPKPKKKTNSFEKKVKQDLERKKRVRERREAALRRVQKLPKQVRSKSGNMVPPPSRNVQYKRKRENWSQVNQQKHEANLGYMPPPLYRPGSSKDLNFYEFKDKGYMCGWKAGVSGCSAKECNFCVQGFNLQNYKNQIAKLYRARQNLKKYLYKFERGANGYKQTNQYDPSVTRKEENEYFMEFAKARREIYNMLPCYWNNCFEKYPEKFTKSTNNRTRVIQMTPNTLREMKATVYYPPGTEPKPYVAPKRQKTKIGRGVNNASPITASGLTPEANLQIKVAKGQKLTKQEQKNWNAMTKSIKKTKLLMKGKETLKKFREKKNKQNK